MAIIHQKDYGNYKMLTKITDDFYIDLEDIVTIYTLEDKDVYAGDSFMILRNNKQFRIRETQANIIKSKIDELSQQRKEDK